MGKSPVQSDAYFPECKPAFSVRIPSLDWNFNACLYLAASKSGTMYSYSVFLGMCFEYLWKQLYILYLRFAGWWGHDKTSRFQMEHSTYHHPLVLLICTHPLVPTLLTSHFELWSARVLIQHRFRHKMDNLHYRLIFDHVKEPSSRKEK
jgi:hypothetical protein